MSSLLIKSFIRTRFKLSGTERVSAQIRKTADRYLELAEQIDADRGSVPTEVPVMFGVDEDMRNWSFFMVLEHNAIVNRNITKLVECLARGELPQDGFDPKKDVMPSADPGVEQVDAFAASIDHHCTVVAGLGKIRGTLQRRHPVFGMLDAHGWHCMFGLHLKLHVKQAQRLVLGARN